MKSSKHLDTGLFIQLIMVLVLVILLVLSIFWNFLLPIAEIVAGLALMVMAYNNNRVYNRKALTWLYLIFGIFLVLSSGWQIFNG